MIGARGLEPFDISVLGAGDHVWLSAQSRQGSIFGVSRAFPRWEGLDGTQPADWLTRSVAHAEQVDEQARSVGRALRDLVFGVPEIGTLLHHTRGVAASRGAQLLVRVLAAPREVSSWPWELMIDPQDPGRHLTRAPDVHVVRAARQRTYAVRETPIAPPLNLLLVMSSPLPAPGDNDPPFDLYAEKRSLLTELAPLVERGLLRVEVEDRPTVDRLRARIGAQQRGFHVLHYLGHAQQVGLKLEDAAGSGRLVDSARFTGLLQQLPDLRLAVFAGCETARAPAEPDSARDAYSSADLCVRDACPMVVGMQAVLPFGTERIFTRYFYQALTGGQPVAEAVRLARIAIADDEQAGGLVNWAVPCLFVGGSMPGPLTDPNASGKPPVARRSVGLKLDLMQRETWFISRLVELREAIDVLGGRNEARLLMVFGPPSTGKTGLLDRVLEELDGVVAQLFVPAPRLLDKPDPVLELATLVAGLIRETGRRPAPRARWTATEWWERLLEDLDRTPMAVVIDDADRLRGTEPGALALVEALRRLTARRGRTRLAVVATQKLPVLTDDLDQPMFKSVQLAALGWNEVWQWIRRNLPILTRYDQRELSGYYARLPRLEHWELLAARLANRGNTRPDELTDIVKSIVDGLGVPSGAGVAPPPVFGSTTDGAPETERAPAHGGLRVAVAGPYSTGRETQFATGVTALAADHEVAGRVAGGDAGLTAALAQLLTLDSPFDEDGGSSTEECVRWLERAEQSDAHIILLDFASPESVPEMDEVIARLAGQGRLIIGAGGNFGERRHPAWHPDVLAVGRLTADGGLPPEQQVASVDPVKPELFAPEQLAGTRLADAVNREETKGTSFAALHVVAAAILVWATDRGLPAAEVRRLLVEGADPVELPGRTVHRLNLACSLYRARRQQILDALERGPLDVRELTAKVGLGTTVVVELVERLVEAKELRYVRTAERSSVDQLEYPDATYLAYRRLRQQPFSRQRTVAGDQLVEGVRRLADRGRFSAETVRTLWDSGEDGRRIVALGIIQSMPALGGVDVVADAIRRPRSPFEHFHALQAACMLVDRLDGVERQVLRDAVEQAGRPDQPFPLGRDTSRLALHHSLSKRLAVPD